MTLSASVFTSEKWVIAWIKGNVYKAPGTQWALINACLYIACVTCLVGLVIQLIVSGSQRLGDVWVWAHVWGRVTLGAVCTGSE